MIEQPTTTPPVCRICGGAAADSFDAKEMMFGTREVFNYFTCADCGCVQITDIPDDLGPYYPDNYYSYGINKKRVRPWKKLVRNARSRYAIERKGIWGPLFSWRDKADPLLIMYGDLGVKLSDRVLDIGGGGGGHVWLMRQAGFSNALAVDPFLAEDMIVNGETLAVKADVFTYQGTADFITFHHSYEHMTDPLGVLARTRDLLADDGRVLIRVPTVSSEAWDEYGTDWVSMDPPRHLFLFSHDSLNRAAMHCGFKVEKLWCDSNAFQFWGSEQYRRDMPLEDPRSYSKNPAASIFSADDIAAFEARARELNARMRGDSVCLLLKKDMSQ